MNMDACLPGHVAAEATAATEGGNTKAEEGGGGDGRRRESGPLGRTGDGESKMKNAITILKNGPGLPQERTSIPGRPVLERHLGFLD